MIRLTRSDEHRWTIDKNVNSPIILTEHAINMAKSPSFNMADISRKTISNSRGGVEGNLITAGVRLLQAKYYMFGYDVKDPMSGQKRFMPSPMTVNLMAGLTQHEQANNFLVNLFCIQYPNPANRTPACFQVYAGRLIIKLLLESRLGRRQYIDECIWFLPFIEQVSKASYEKLVCSILEYRNLPYAKKQRMFASVNDYEHLFANITHELNYYFLRLFRNMHVFVLNPDASHNEGKIFRFKHNDHTYRTDAYDSHKKISGYVTLSSDVMESAKKLTQAYSAFERPTNENDPDIYNRGYWLSNLYEIEPLDYLNCIRQKVDYTSEITAIVSEMVRASKFGSRNGTEFERALKPFIQLFAETCDVEIISGPGNTDLLCSMEELPTGDIYKMNVDGKTRKSAVSDLNERRLTKHINKHGAKFCIVVAPRFARGVNNDIAASRIVTVNSEVLANYCYCECIRGGKEAADFSSLLEIISANLGTDITQKVQQLTISRYSLPTK